jgi:hypothetical protein
MSVSVKGWKVCGCGRYMAKQKIFKGASRGTSRLLKQEGRCWFRNRREICRGGRRYLNL